ncbi:MAG: thioredoxin domain-containing protein [Verrucomicrobiae bacterium]|nr:thioredoxin domain-containing protein [Verrucomicrobiae bacterium]
MNRLKNEKSPYLLRHATDPVDWFPWGAEAFQAAKSTNRPIFLSIGYSSCHWCHVMERESFCDPAVAAFLNDNFVCIKVDREERPDVDNVYMTFLQAATGTGGWPLNVFLTPERKPFFGGTYFPPHERAGRPSFMHVLQQVSKVWREHRSEVEASAEAIHAQLEAAVADLAPTGMILSDGLIKNAARMLKQEFDARHGGFGGPPKFPQPGALGLLLRCAKRFKDNEALRMVLFTCGRMADGAIHDQLGGGFARYTVDAAWMVPHFEKMLYDNAQLARVYLDAHLLARAQTDRFADVARAILDYVLRDMTHPEGGFYSAEDAESEGHEGKFYCWTRAELRKLLTPEEFEVVESYFGITDEGNFIELGHPSPLPGQNVLGVRRPLIGQPAAVELLESAKHKMIAARAQRPRPARDDKILTSWNGLMLGALAHAYSVLGDEKYLAAALRNLNFIRTRLWVPARAQGAGSQLPDQALQTPGTLYHRWRDGARDDVQLLQAYAFLLDGVVELYQATLAPEMLEFAIELANAMIVRFYDPEVGGFWQSPPDAGDLILRIKDASDTAEPSGNAMAALALLKLAALTGRDTFKEPAEATLRLFAPHMNDVPQAVPYLLQALDFWLDEPVRVVIAGEPTAPGTRALVRAAHSVYGPNTVVLGTSGPAANLVPESNRSGAIAAFVCTAEGLSAPATGPEQLKSLLARA